MAYSKTEAIKIVTTCSKLYRDNLVNNQMLFILSDKHKQTSALEVSFDANNFLHLTGLKIKSSIFSAKKFYEQCLLGKLNPDDFEFAKDGTTQMKLMVLPKMMDKSLSANMVGEYNNRQPALFTEKIVGNIRGCIGFTEDKTSHRLVPNTILQVDTRDYIKEPFRIIMTCRKKKDDATYNEVVYVAKKVDWSKISFPAEYEYLAKPC